MIALVLASGRISRSSRICGRFTLSRWSSAIWQSAGFKSFRMASTNSRHSISLNVATWNIAAINNNPFEYWITHDDPEYNELMDDIQEFVSNPGNNDVHVDNVFTEHMFDTVVNQLKVCSKLNVEQEAQLTNEWNSNYRHRRIVSDFLKDGDIGKKRLVSMPDRMTNTVNLANGSRAFRPTAINFYPHSFENIAGWWKQWLSFMFEEKISIKRSDGVRSVKGVDLVMDLSPTKYPAVTELEASISVPLQVVCCAMFDAILIHILFLTKPAKWQSLRHDLCSFLGENKIKNTLSIIEKQYANYDVFFLQEVSQECASQILNKSAFQNRYVAVLPAVVGNRDQISAILVKRNVFQPDSIEDVTHLVYDIFKSQNVPVAEGDLVAAKAKFVQNGASALLVSFHGDTNGLATIPVLQAVHDVAEKDMADTQPLLILGLDANAHNTAESDGKFLSLKQFTDFYMELGMASTWSHSSEKDLYTTYNARTFLQPQLNKATSRHELREKGDINLKDFVLYYSRQFCTTEYAIRDNTGTMEFKENTPFPTKKFPSDHAIVSSSIRSAL